MKTAFEVLKHGMPTVLHVLEGEAFKIGRLPSCHLWLEDETVSRMHAVVEREGEGLRVFDLNSIHGTWVSGVRVDGSKTLKSGDEILFGALRVRVTFPYVGAAAQVVVAEYIPPRRP
jgi:pSer/pThr/pTyr-binding forkhead associated (FHA) protein